MLEEQLQEKRKVYVSEIIGKASGYTTYRLSYDREKSATKCMYESKYSCIKVINNLSLCTSFIP